MSTKSVESSSSSWKKVQGKQQYPHHYNKSQNNGDRSNSNDGYRPRRFNPRNNVHAKSEDSKDYLMKIIINNTMDEPCNETQDWNNIIKEINDKFLELKDEKQKSILMNNIIKFSLHEVLQDVNIIKYLNSLHKVGQHAPIHIALWPNKDWFKSCPGMERGEEDIFKTVEVIMEKSKFSVLEQNLKNETVLKSLFEAEKHDYLGKEIAEKIYKFLMNPNEKLISKMTKEIFNKITESNFENFRATICWLVSLPTCKMDEEIFEKLQYVKTLDRDSKTGKYREIQKVASLFEKLNKFGPGKSDFDRYFKQNPWSTKKVSNIYENITKHFLLASLQDAHNTEIVGGAVGEFGFEKDILEYCNSIENEYPETVMTCLAHAYPRFKNSSMITQLKRILQNTRGKVKFNIELILDNFEPGFLNASKTQSVSAPNISIVSSSNQMSFENNPLIERMTLRNLNKLPVDEEPSINQDELNPPELDDVAYSFNDYMVKYSKEIICHAIIAKSIESITTEVGFKAIPVLIKFLIEKKGLDKEIFAKVYNSEIENIFELFAEDNPMGSKRIKTILDNLFAQKVVVQEKPIVNKSSNEKKPVEQKQFVNNTPKSNGTKKFYRKK